MRSPKDMKTIQIDITNACVHTCSNCTRLCGHHKKNFFMDFNTFKKAVDSLEGFEGTIGIMGGEPTLHPEFVRFVEYLNSKYKDKKEDSNLIKPTNTFMENLLLEIRQKNYTYEAKAGDDCRIKGPGLWSSLASNYYKYYELIQDTFKYQCVNDHNNVSYHQPILVTRKELGISDDEWIKLRDNCWMQNCWSASITPKGAFFCEVAASLDMLFDGPGGWKIESEWWKKGPEDFKDQLHWCELCGVALQTRSRNANEEIDDVSPQMYEKLKQLGSPKVKNGKVNIYSESLESIKVNGQLDKIRKNKYNNNDFERLSNNNNSVYPKGFNAIIYYNESQSIDEFILNLSDNLIHFENIVVVVNDDCYNQVKNNEIFEKDNVTLIIRDKFVGRSINKAISIFGSMSYIIIVSSDIILNADFKDIMKTYVINPGTYHYNYFDNNECRLFKSNLKTNNSRFILFNSYASALQKAGFDGIAYCKDINEFSALWYEKKRIIFNDDLLTSNSHEGMDLVTGLRYVVYGTGEGGKRVTNMILDVGATVAFYCNSFEKNWGQNFMGKIILSPEELLDRKDEFDKIVIASMAYNDIKNNIISVGFNEDDIVSPIF